jgi:hypothetical protein
MWLIAALACNEDPPAGDDTGTPPDTTPEGPEQDPPLGGEILPFPACVLGSTDGRLDLEGACADDICIGQTFEDAASLFGEAPYCLSLLPGSTTCFFGTSLLVGYTDADGDGQPDAGKRAYVVQVTTGWPGGTEDGLSVGMSPACWVEALGVADQVSLVAEDDGYYALSLAWDAYYLTVYDQQDDAYAFFPDGVVETVSFHNGVYGP